MSNLTFRVKPNDEVTLKHKIGDSRIMARLGKLMYYYWSDKTVVIEETECVCHVTKDDNVESFYYIWVRDRSGNQVMLPISSISRNYALRRDHKRYKLHNKILIVE